jgi:hypothetical protein
MAAFTSAILDKSDFGNRSYVSGTFTGSGGSTGGTITTGLRVVEFISVQPRHATAVLTDACVVNNTLPLKDSATGAVTVVTVADTVGVWFAIGRK